MLKRFRLTVAVGLLLISKLCIATSLSSPEVDAPRGESIEACYKAFTKNHGEALGNYLRSFRGQGLSAKEVRSAMSEEFELSQETITHCGWYFLDLAGSLKKNSRDSTTPNLFPKYYYDFMTDAPTLASISKALVKGIPKTPVSSSISPSIHPTRAVSASIAGTSPLKVPVRTTAPRAFNLQPPALEVPFGGELPDEPYGSGEFRFTEDQIKGFIFNLSHHLAMGQDSLYDYPDSFCNHSFIQQNNAEMGCRAVIAKYYMLNIPVIYEGFWLFTLMDSSPDAVDRLVQWAEDITFSFRSFYPVVAVFGKFPLDSTLVLSNVGGLIGIPDLDEGEFDPLVRVPDDQQPLLYSSEEFQSSCERFTADSDIRGASLYCGAISSHSSYPNALISMLVPKVSGINFHARLREVEISANLRDIAGDDLLYQKTFPGAVVHGFGDFTGNGFSIYQLLINSYIKIDSAPANHRFLGDLEYNPSYYKVPAHRYRIYANALYDFSSRYLLTKNRIEVEDCSYISDFYQVPTMEGFPKIIGGNTLTDMTGKKCESISPSSWLPQPTQTPKPTAPTHRPTSDALSAAQQTALSGTLFGMVTGFLVYWNLR